MQVGNQKTISLFYLPYEYARNIVIILILGVFSGNTDPQTLVNGNLVQISLLVGLSFTHIVMLYFSNPLSSLRATYVENIASVGEFCTYATAFTLVMIRRINPILVPTFLPIVDNLLLIAQLLAILAKIGGEISIVYTLLSNVARSMMMMITPEKIYKQDRAKILAFKYACKWYIRVFNCPPPSRAHYFISSANKPLEVWEKPLNKANYLNLKYLKYV